MPKDYSYKPDDGDEIDLGRYSPGFRSEIAGQWGDHRIPGQRGVLHEDLGEGALSTTLRLQFVGPTRSEYKKVMGDMARRRRGRFLHPLRGSRAIVIRRFSEEMNFVNTGPAVLVDVHFEDDVVSRIDAFRDGPSAAAQNTTAQANFADQAAVSFRDLVFARSGSRQPNPRLLAGRALSAVSAATTTARSYATAAQDAFTFAAFDPSVSFQLNAIPSQVQFAQRQLQLAGRASEINDSLIALERMLYNARRLDEAVRANQPIPIETRVTRSPGQSIYAFVQAHYGTTSQTPQQMRDLVTLILRLNPHIRRPSFMPVDTRITRPALV